MPTTALRPGANETVADMTARVSRPIDLTRALAIEGFMSALELEWLATHAQQSDRIVEVGCWQGRSTRALADHCPGRVYTVDAWEGYAEADPAGAAWLAARCPWPAARAAFAANLRDHLETGRVVLVSQTAAAAAITLCQSCGLGWADLVFLDGDHHEAALRLDIATYRPLLRSGGILAGHDYGHPEWATVARAVHRVWPTGVQRCDSIWWVRL
jgi:predicted O-methyltransferase YrrM